MPCRLRRGGSGDSGAGSGDRVGVSFRRGAGIVGYGVLLWLWPTVVLQVTAFMGVAVILGILAWVGWTMATTPPPAPLEFGEPVPAAPTSAAEKPENKL